MPCMRDVAADAAQSWNLGKELGLVHQGQEEDMIRALEVLEVRDMALLNDHINAGNAGSTNLS